MSESVNIENKKQNRQYWCSKTPFICSIVPIGAAVLIVFVALAFPVVQNCFGLPASVMSLIPCCTSPLVALVMVPMGIYSIVSGIAEIRVPDGRGKTLVVVAIVLGILDIAAGSGSTW